MNQKIGLAVIVMITLGTTVIATTTIPLQQQSAYAGYHSHGYPGLAPVSITGDNIYVAWWTNKTANNNDEVMFRASTDAGKTFGDKINLSNTTNADSNRVQIDGDPNSNSVVVTWWETNQTSDVPVMRVSTDNGETFGETTMLSANSPVG
ncbi:MAG: sialidase family protein [Nitrososphaeraceae archaeon]